MGSEIMKSQDFFDRIETGQLDALVNGGQAWAILSRLTRNKAIDSVRYDNAVRRGGEGGRRVSENPIGIAQTSSETAFDDSHRSAVSISAIGSVAEREQNLVREQEPRKPRAETVSRDELPLDAVRDQSQRPGDFVSTATRIARIGVLVRPLTGVVDLSVANEKLRAPFVIDRPRLAAAGPQHACDLVVRPTVA